MGIALAGINDEPLRLRLPIDRKAHGLDGPRAVYRIDATGRHRLGAIAPDQTALDVDLPIRAICVLELCTEK